MERIWLVASVVLMTAAGVSLWTGHVDAAFVTATLGVVSWFLSLRAKLKRNREASKSVESADDHIEDPDDN
jgi:hypothetical protein